MRIAIVMMVFLVSSVNSLVSKDVFVRGVKNHRHLFQIHRCLSTNVEQAGTLRKRVVFLGTPQFAAESLQTIVEKSVTSIASPFDVVAVVTQPPGDKKKMSPVHKLGNALKLPVLSPETAKDEEFLAHLESLSVDLCITVAYGNFLPKRFLNIPKFGTVNIHPSLLPLYRGAAPVQRSLQNGDSSTGVSVAFTVHKMDAGPIIAQVPYRLTGHEKAPEVLTECFRIGTRVLIDALPSIFDGTVRVTNQVDADATHAPKLTVEDSVLDFATMSAVTVHNRCRGFQDWPGVLATFQIGSNIVKMKLITTYVIEPAADSAERTHNVSVVKYIDSTGKKAPDMLRVVCGDGSVLGILEVLPVSRKQMPIKDFMNGIKGDKTIQWIRNTPAI